MTGPENRDQSDDGVVRVDRRTTIKWMAATMAAAYAGCSPEQKQVGEEIPAAPQRKLLGAAARANGIGYGTDPDLINPAVPWARTMSEAQRRTAAALCDVILPEDERSPAASTVGVHEFIDEWVSAPYPQQQDDREVILAGLEWLERQSQARFGSAFTDAAEKDKSALLDMIAWPEKAAPELADQVEFFRRFRYLTVGAFYTTETGIDDVGYIGNFAITGDYPGPSEEAMAHLAGVLEQLGLA